LKTEELQAFQEITGNIKKLVEFAHNRDEDTAEAIKAFDGVAGSFERFKAGWKHFTISTLQSVLKACDLSNTSEIVKMFYSLIYQMDDDPEDSLVKDLYYSLVEEIAYQLGKSDEQYGKLVFKRENTTYDLMQKEL